MVGDALSTQNMSPKTYFQMSRHVAIFNWVIDMYAGDTIIFNARAINHTLPIWRRDSEGAEMKDANLEIIVP